MTERLVHIAQAAAAAGHGNKEAIYTAACAELGLSRATLLRALGEVALKPERRRRSDAGDVALPLAEAKLISAVLMESHRKNNKRLLSIGQAVQMLRENGMVRAEAVDADGVLRPLGDSAISRALRVFGLHPEQLLRPAPSVELRSLHPNHVWQIDASLCVLYYLHTRNEREAGLQVMRHEVFYKNKPGNLRAIEADRVWSYEVTDHNSGSIYLQYVMGAESGQNMLDVLIDAMQQREGEAMHGAPLQLMCDPGGGNVGALAKNFCRRMQIKLLPHASGNARATGQVENARNLIERGFESGLKFRPVHNLAELNALARKWVRLFCSTQVHTRHGRTRWAQWQTITEEQLRIAPPRGLCRELLTHAPEERKVTDKLRVPFMGYGEFSVADVPNVMVGEKLLVTYNPYDLVDGKLASAMVVEHDADGNEVLRRIPHVERGADGFAVTANIIGEDYTRPADTRADVNRKLVQRIAMDAGTQAEAEAKRKAKTVPFGGRVDPYKAIEAAPASDWMPKRGTPLQPTAQVAGDNPGADPLLNLFQAASELARRGVAMTPERNAQVAAWHPDGVRESEIAALQQRLQVRAGLRVMNGGGTPE
jgi:hypothetical protein